MAWHPSPQTHPEGSSKVSQTAFEITIGALLGITLLIACGRTYARISFFKRYLIDDVFFYIATIMLITATGLLYAEAPLIYLQVDVQTGVRKPPRDFIAKLILGLKIQTGITVMTSGSLFAIKFSFLFFLKNLIWQSKRLMIWWWVIIGVCIPAALVSMCMGFIICTTYDERILEKCGTPSALSRQNASMKAFTVYDIITDAMIMSIPILLLWDVKVSLRRKLALGGILCLSVFMVIIAVIRISAGKLPNGQVDICWIFMWHQIECCVAVIVVSVSAFRALFVAKQAGKYNARAIGSGPREKSGRSWAHSKASTLFHKGKEISGKSSRGKHEELCEAPMPVFDVEASPKRWSSSAKEDSAHSEGSLEEVIELPLHTNV